MTSTENTQPIRDIIIRARDLTKKFGDFAAVDSLDMTVPRGSIFGFIGPSGSGKTTTVRLLTGILKPTSGELTVLGKEPTNFTKSDRGQIGYLIQQTVMFPELTVWENLNFVASLYGVGLFRGGRLNRLLDFVELRGDRGKLAKNLSGGMKRRLALASTLIHNPQLIFLDEPTAGIDPILRQKFWDYFKELQKQGHTLFVTTQYVSEAAYCDVVGVISDGKLVAVDTPEALRKAAIGGEIVHITTEEWIDHVQRKYFEDLPFTRGRVKVIDENEIEVIVDEASTAMPMLMERAKEARLTIKRMEETPPSFDEVFVRIVEAERKNATPA